MSVSKEEILHIASLSRLNLTEKELEKYTTDLSNIVDYAKELEKIDIDGVKPTAHILDIQNVFRKDNIEKSYLREEILKNAKTKAAGCITVPKVVE